MTSFRSNGPKAKANPKIEDSYAYNGEGLRASQTINGTTSYLAWDPTESTPLILSDGTNSYIYGPGGLPVEQIINGQKRLRISITTSKAPRGC